MGRLAHAGLGLHLPELHLRLPQHVLEDLDAVGQAAGSPAHGDAFLFGVPAIVPHNLPAPNAGRRAVPRSPRRAPSSPPARPRPAPSSRWGRGPASGSGPDASAGRGRARRSSRAALGSRARIVLLRLVPWPRQCAAASRCWPSESLGSRIILPTGTSPVSPHPLHQLFSVCLSG